MGRSRGEFQQVHGFRKLARSQFAKAGMRPEASETLLGHKANYYKPTLDELEEEYLKAVPLLTVSEVPRLKEKMEAQEHRHESEWAKARLEILELKEREKEWRETIERLRPYMEELKRRREKGV